MLFHEQVNWYLSYRSLQACYQKQHYYYKWWKSKIKSSQLSKFAGHAVAGAVPFTDGFHLALIQFFNPDKFYLYLVSEKLQYITEKKSLHFTPTDWKRYNNFENLYNLL